MNLPGIKQLDVPGKRVLVRADLDLPEKDEFRLKASLQTYKFLIENQAKVIVIGHKGRPNGVVDGKYSLEDASKRLGEVLEKDVKFVGSLVRDEVGRVVETMEAGDFILLENLRFDSREESNDEDFSKLLAGFADCYVNEAFSNSHRSHASIVGVPKLLPYAAGFHFISEVENLEKVFSKPKRPVLVILSGIKEDKLSYIEGLKKFADRVLVAGRLPEYLGEVNDDKLVVARLVPDKEDITVNSIEKFETEINSAGTIVVSGPMGKFEDEGHRLGTERVLKKVAETDAYKVSGGGDTINAISILNLDEKFDWISVGGGAMLEFLIDKTLPGIEALSS